MGMLKKGSRLLNVDGIQYRWRVRNRPSYSQAILKSPLVLAVERADPPGAKLVVELFQAHPGNWLMAPVVAVLPSDVESHIRSALAAGWHPDVPGKSFLLTHR